MKALIDSHTHTLISGHAYNTLTEMARHAADIGLPTLAITEHAPSMPCSTNLPYFDNLRTVPRELFGVKLLLGAELNILGPDGEIDLPDRCLKGLDIVIASIHLNLYDGERMDLASVTGAYVNAMKNPYVQIIGHPDDARTAIDYETLVKGAKENHVLLEINSASLVPNSHRIGAVENDRVLLSLCKEADQPVIMGSDAHFFTHIADFENAEKLMASVGFPDYLVANYDRDLYESYIPPVTHE